MRIAVSTAFVLSVALLSGCGGGSSTEYSNARSHIDNPQPYEEAPALDQSTKDAYLQAINDARSQEQDCGGEGVFPPAPPLTWNDALYKAAYEHDVDMAESGTFSHNGSGTESDYTAQVQDLPYSTYVDRIENNGYGSWSRLAENIAVRSASVDDVVQAWLDSPGHCANLMNPDLTEMGLAHYHDPDSEYVDYWTLDLGTPRD
ncbi:CAP domain-containing protein [Nitratifractor sp.]